MAVEFADFTPEEQATVDRIAKRAAKIFREAGMRRPAIEFEMDLSAVHAKVPLRLAELEQADDFNFGHDIAGIYRHLNRQTGELEDFFVPRFADHQHARA